MNKEDLKRLAKRLCLTFSFIAIGLNAFAKPVLEKIDLLSSDKSYSNFNLKFSEEFEGPIRIENGQGAAKIFLPHISITGKNKVSLPNIDKGPILAVSVNPDPTGIAITISYRDILAYSDIDYSTNGSYLVIAAKTKPSPAASLTDSSKSSTESVSILSTLIWPGVVLLIVSLAALYFILLIYKKKLKSGKSSREIKVLETFHISPKEKIQVVQIDGLDYAISVSGQNKSLLSKLDSPRRQVLEELAAEPGHSLASIKTALTDAGPKKTEAINLKNIKNSFSFKDELTQRINQLKPLR